MIQTATSSPSALPASRGARRGAIFPVPPLPVHGSTVVDMPVERLWATFVKVRGWRRWNPCFRATWTVGRPLEVGATIVLIFNVDGLPSFVKMPATATIVECEPCRRVTWEVAFPGFHALHSYEFAAVDEHSCRFGSWEVAEGTLYDVAHGFWIRHFRWVCESSLRGAVRLGTMG
jgi:hypothetical protein